MSQKASSRIRDAGGTIYWKLANPSSYVNLKKNSHWNFIPSLEQDKLFGSEEKQVDYLWPVHYN
jgi:hypothetical protein